MLNDQVTKRRTMRAPETFCCEGTCNRDPASLVGATATSVPVDYLAPEVKRNVHEIGAWIRGTTYWCLEILWWVNHQVCA